ncbi:TOBE domain-containing protein, partial [Candidatus Bipolaricaulota bacterium]|nr:TOBE domain-containing protein [Candidatus Bipolaricaulota bacterium]
DGLIQQYASPQQTYDQPANQFVAGFIGSPAMNFLLATVSQENGQTILSGDGFHIAVPAERLRGELPARVVLGLRPEDLDGPTKDVADTVGFTVTVREQLGHSLLIYGYVDEQRIVASLDPHSAIDVDSAIRLKVDVDTMHVFDPETAVMFI